jgi:integrase
LIDTGLRATELCNLELKHLNIKKKIITAKIKGGVWGDAAFFDFTAHCLSHWLGIRSLSANPEVTTIFVSVGGRTRGQQLTISGIRTLTLRLAKLSGIDPFSPHATRRTFATLAIGEISEWSKHTLAF